MRPPEESDLSSRPPPGADPRGSLQAWSADELRAEIAQRSVAAEARPLEFHAGTLGELRFRAADLQQLLEAVPVGIFIQLDLASPLMVTNRTGAQMLGGFPPAGPRPGPWDVNLPPVPRFQDGREVPPAELPMRRATSEGVTVSGEHYEIRTYDGASLHVLEYASPLIDELGRIRGALVVMVDISELTRAEEALRESEQRLRFLTNAVPALIVSVDSDLRLELGNDRFLRRFGGSMEQVRGRHVRDVVGESTWSEIRPDLERALAGEHVAFEKDLLYPDGSRRWACFDYSPDLDPQGKVRRVAVLGTDIEESKRTEEALRRSESEFRAVFELAEVGMAQINPATGRFVRVNRRFREITGCDDPKLLTKRFSDITHPEDYAKDLVIWEVLRGERDQWEPIEKRIVCADDDAIVWTLSSGSLIRDARGRPSTAVQCMLDITAHKLAEQALARSQAMLTLSQQLARVGSWELDLETLSDPDSNGLQWSDQTYRLFGFEPGEVVATKRMFFELVHPDDRDAVRQTMYAAIAARKNYEVEHRIRLRGTEEERVLQEWATIECASDGRPKRVLGTCQDVTERVRLQRERLELLEAERTARAEAERASRSKDEFLATLGHELRTPLNAILGWTYVLRKSPGLQAAALEGIDVIERNARTQAKLVDDLLDLHGIASGKLRLELVDVDLASVVAMAVAAIRPSAEGKGLTLTCSGECSGKVRGDPDRLQQVVSNLLANSVKFTPSGGSISVVLSRKDAWAEIALTDTGQGISPEHLTEIFERFRQADSSTTRKHGGLGIGLALVRQLVALHGGRVRAESEGEGRGSRFVVELPIATRAEEAEDVTGAVSTRVAGSHVLVVDDEPDGLEATRLLLEESGAVVATASSAAEALERLEHESFDAILSDIGMPQTDGYAFMTEVRRRGIDTPAGALTALTREEDRSRAFEAGYSAHVGKPIDPPTLLATVRSLAASH